MRTPHPQANTHRFEDPIVCRLLLVEDAAGQPVLAIDEHGLSLKAADGQVVHCPLAELAGRLAPPRVGAGDPAPQADASQAPDAPEHAQADAPPAAGEDGPAA